MSAWKRYGVQNRPTPRMVQLGVLLAVAIPAAILGTVAAIAAEILTVNWPRGEAS